MIKLLLSYHLFFQEVSLHPGLQPTHQGSEAIRQKSAVMYFQDPALLSGMLLSVSRSWNIAKTCEPAGCAELSYDEPYPYKCRTFFLYSEHAGSVAEKRAEGLS